LALGGREGGRKEGRKEGGGLTMMYSFFIVFLNI
jgi:hypothetical protein